MTVRPMKEIFEILYKIYLPVNLFHCGRFLWLGFMILGALSDEHDIMGHTAVGEVGVAQDLTDIQIQSRPTQP